MVKIKGWKKLNNIPTELEEGDNFYSIWEGNGENLFIIDDNFGEYIVGTKIFSQMGSPVIRRRTKTLAKAKEYATKYMKVNSNG